MQTTVQQHPHAAVVRLVGELDAHTSSALRVLLGEQVLAGSGNLVLDLTDLSFIDSSGLAALIAADKGTRRAGMALVLAHPAPAVRKVLAVTGLDAVMTITDSVEDALEGLAPQL